MRENKLLIDAKTVGVRGQAFPKSRLSPKLKWPLAAVFAVGWSVFFVLVAFYGDNFGAGSVVALLAATLAPLATFRAHRRWTQAEPVPGTLYSCAQCGTWWTAPEGSDLKSILRAAL